MDPAATLAAALAGDRPATLLLLRQLAPVLHARVMRILARRGGAQGGRDVRQEAEDLVQDVLCTLFADGGRVLRQWDPARGLSLANYVGLYAEREAGHVLRSRRRSPYAADPTESDEIARLGGGTGGPESAVGNRELMDRVWARMEAELSPRGNELFRRLVLEEESVESVCAACGMTRDAVYAWRSRLLKRARALLEELSAAPPSDRNPAVAIPPEERAP